MGLTLLARHDTRPQCARDFRFAKNADPSQFWAGRGGYLANVGSKHALTVLTAYGPNH